MKLPDGSTEGRRALSGTRQVIVGLGAIFLSLPLWWGTTHFVPSLAATRVVATAVCSTMHGAGETQLLRAFAAARTNAAAAEATFEPIGSPDSHGVTYYLSVTGDTSERARTDLATLTDALKDAFPSAERNLMVSINNSTVPEPNALGRKIVFGLRITVVLMILGGQLLTVIGGHKAGLGRAGLFAALTLSIMIAIAPGGSGYRARTGRRFELPDWRFVVLFLSLTLVSMILSLWLTRRSSRTGGQPRS